MSAKSADDPPNRVFERHKSARASRSLRVVRNARVSCCRPPRRVSLGTRMVTSIPALAMSIPAARSANSGSSSASSIIAPTMTGDTRSRPSAGAAGQAEIWSAGSKHQVTALKSSSRRSDCLAGSGPPRHSDVSGRPHPDLRKQPRMPHPCGCPHGCTARATARQRPQPATTPQPGRPFTPLPRHPCHRRLFSLTRRAALCRFRRPGRLLGPGRAVRVWPGCGRCGFSRWHR